MRITLNGDLRDHPDGLTVKELLADLGLNPAKVAVERNR